jgi:hypothetical protein
MQWLSGLTGSPNQCAAPGMHRSEIKSSGQPNRFQPTSWRGVQINECRFRAIPRLRSEFDLGAGVSIDARPRRRCRRGRRDLAAHHRSNRDQKNASRPHSKSEVIAQSPSRQQTRTAVDRLFSCELCTSDCCRLGTRGASGSTQVPDSGKVNKRPALSKQTARQDQSHSTAARPYLPRT